MSFRLGCLLLICVLFVSCKAVLIRLTGFTEPALLADSQIQHYAKKYGIPGDRSYKVDTAYWDYFMSFDSTSHDAGIKNHLQPLQISYYNREGQLLSYHVNCYAGGYPNLKWNRNGVLGDFVPRTTAPLDTLLSLEKYVSFISPVGKASKAFTTQADYYVLVQWSAFFTRQSKRLVKFVKSNLQNAPKSANVEVLWLNNDNVYARQMVLD